MIGRSLYPLIREAGFNDINVEPKTIYADNSKPEVVSGFSKKTFIAMVESVGQEVMDKKFITKENWVRGLEDLNKATKRDGSFIYTFFKAFGVYR